MIINEKTDILNKVSFGSLDTSMITLIDTKNSMAGHFMFSYLFLTVSIQNETFP